MQKVQHLKIPLEEIKMATNNFSKEKYIGTGGFGDVYGGKLTISGQQYTVAVKRLNHTRGQGDREFLMEIQMLSSYKHKNLISLIGFCIENGESILVYEHAKYGSLDRYLHDDKLSWVQRLKISLEVARGLNYLHNGVGPQHKVWHQDIKSSNILLNENWEAKVSGFGLSKIRPSNVEFTFLLPNACGTLGYIDPAYEKTGILTRESDVFSFGVVLFELLCGRLALVARYEDERRFLASLAQVYCEQNKLHEIILPSIMDEIKLDSLNVYSLVAYQCLNKNRGERPTMAWIVERLEKAVEFQVRLIGHESSRLIAPESSRLIGPESSRLIGPDSSLLGEFPIIDALRKVQHLKIPLEKIKLATNNFSHENYIAQGGFGKVYIGKINASGHQTTVAVKRLDRTRGQGDHEFLTEIQMLSCYKHTNIISLLGFSNESGDGILVYEHAKYGSLDKYLSDDKLSWVQRLKISLGAARGFSYLHNDVGLQHRVLHRDIKSSNILLNEYWEAKISDFGLSKIGPSNLQFSYMFTKACGTDGYIDPQYRKTGILTKESDVYSFGVVLFEILCGRLALIQEYHDERRFLESLAPLCCEQDRLYEIILPSIQSDMKVAPLNIFSRVAYQCLKENRSERPTMASIAEKLEEALKLQVNSKVIGIIRLGSWGKRSGGPDDNWSFELEPAHKLQKIIIVHGEMIYSLMFTESNGVLHTSDNGAAWVVGQIVSEVTIDFDEEIVGINGCIGTRDNDTIISSLSFKTNKRIHGPFGRTSNSVFSIPFDKASLVGFYGFRGYCIDGIGVYVKAHDETIRVGTWGTSDSGGPQNIWSFQLEKNHHLKKITIDHGDLIYSLMFTTMYRGLTYTSEKFGGCNGGDKVSEVTFDWNEEINAISGTVASSKDGYTVVSSISFVTNKKTYGPFGDVRGTPFTVPWDDASFAGFYGLCWYYIDSIGVYLKAIK